jgi:hypothetical protein
MSVLNQWIAPFTASGTVSVHGASWQWNGKERNLQCTQGTAFLAGWTALVDWRDSFGRIRTKSSYIGRFLTITRVPDG